MPCIAVESKPCRQTLGLTLSLLAAVLIPPSFRVCGRAAGRRPAGATAPPVARLLGRAPAARCGEGAAAGGPPALQRRRQPALGPVRLRPGASGAAALAKPYGGESWIL